MPKHFFTVDWWLVAPVIVLGLLSLTTLLSLDASLFTSQLIYWVISLIIFFIFANIRYDAFIPFAKYIYIFAVLSLGVVLVLGIESHGAVRWIEIFGGRIQFSEICKPLLAIVLASFLSQHDNIQPRYLFLTLLLLLPILVFIYMQPDLGDTIIYLAVTLFILIIYGYRFIWFFVSALPLAAAIPFIWFHLHGYQRERIITFLHPASDQTGASYNAMQAIIAVGSGMFFGRGLSEGTQSGLRFLPERQTDFIFASLTEGLGFIGGAIVIIAFAVLLYRLYVLFRTVSDPYAKLFIASAFALILIHVFLNIGMNLGLVPIVGVTLPFASFGGSSLLANSILLGLVTAISRTFAKTETLEIR